MTSPMTASTIVLVAEEGLSEPLGASVDFACDEVVSASAFLPSTGAAALPVGPSMGAATVGLDFGAPVGDVALPAGPSTGAATAGLDFGAPTGASGLAFFGAPAGALGPVFFLGAIVGA